MGLAGSNNLRNLPSPTHLVEKYPCGGTNWPREVSSDMQSSQSNLR